MQTFPANPLIGTGAEPKNPRIREDGLALRIFSWTLDPIPRRVQCACTCFFHGAIGLPHVESWVGFPRLSANDDFSRCSISGLQVFRYVPASKFARPPDRSYRCEKHLPQGSRGFYVRAHSCFVTSARSGYANRPNTGNWRYGDLHPARFPALSTPPSTMLTFPIPATSNVAHGFPAYTLTCLLHLKGYGTYPAGRLSAAAS